MAFHVLDDIYIFLHYLVTFDNTIDIVITYILKYNHNIVCTCSIGLILEVNITVLWSYLLHLFNARIICSLRISYHKHILWNDALLIQFICGIVVIIILLNNSKTL